MNAIKACLAVVVGVVLIAITPGYATEKKAVNYTDIQIETVYPGDIVPVGKVVRLRNVITRWQCTASDPRLSGEVVSVYNGTFDSTGSGPVWGTLRVGDDNAGWEITFTGEAHGYFLGQLNWIIKLVGHGVGAYDGLKYEATESVDLMMPSTPSGVGVGEITDSTKE